jgi:DNA-directed RNA polymerase subunit RPC12/RpoP
MRRLVEPLPTPKCKLCGGELFLKRVEPVNPPLEIDAQIYLCTKCGHEHSLTVTHDPYTAHGPR